MVYQRLQLQPLHNMLAMLLGMVLIWKLQLLILPHLLEKHTL